MDVSRTQYYAHVQLWKRLSKEECFLMTFLMTCGILFHAGDQQMDGFDQWAFMTTHSWDEPSKGDWRLEVRNGQSACE